MKHNTGNNLHALVAAYRRVRAPRTLSARLREATHPNAGRRQRAWLWPAAVTGAIVVALGVARLPGRPQMPLQATGVPSLSQLKSHIPSTSLSGYRVPTLGQALKMPTLPKTPSRDKETSTPATDKRGRDAKS